MKRKRYEKPVDLGIPKSREYKLFLEEMLLSSIPRTVYEKSARFAGSLLNIEPDARAAAKIQEAIDFSHLKIKPRDASSLTILFILVAMMPVVILVATRFLFGFGIDIVIGLVAMLVVLPVAYYIYLYPFHTKKIYQIQAGNDIVLLILYMTMYMRNNPNMENAVMFAARNMSGFLSYEIKKLMWDVEVGNYLTINDALIDYSKKWSENKEFIEGIEIIITSTKQPEELRLQMLDEAVDVVLQGNRENAQHFNQRLQLPVILVNALGIILPVMGMVMFPLIAIFLSVDAMTIFIGYDVLLPLVLFFVINSILETRPPTFSKIDIEDNPEVPPEGRFAFGRRTLPAWPFAFAVLFAFSAVGFVLLPASEIIGGIFVTGSIAFGLGLYFLLLSKGRLKIREDTRRIEAEFSEALFQLGSQINTGSPIEISMQRSMRRIGDLKIKDMFARAVSNITTLGLTFEQAFFDKDYGAVREYPSRIIKSVMRTVSESSKRGVKTAAVSMLSISRYLKGIHKTQEEVNEEMSETVSSLKFQAYFLSPMISGVVATLAIIIIDILRSISETTRQTDFAGSFLDAFASISVNPIDFVVIVAIYIIEVSLILSMFINGIESGQDSIGRNALMGRVLIISFVVFTAIFFITLLIFKPIISGVT